MPASDWSRRSKAQGFTPEQRYKRLLAARAADQAEIEIWRRVALELSEQRKENVDDQIRN